MLINGLYAYVPRLISVCEKTKKREHRTGAPIITQYQDFINQTFTFLLLISYLPASAESLPSDTEIRITSPSRMFPSRMIRAAAVSTCFCRKRFKGRAP